MEKGKIWTKSRLENSEKTFFVTKTLRLKEQLGYF
jgi:hypothetical protein